MSLSLFVLLLFLHLPPSFADPRDKEGCASVGVKFVPDMEGQPRFETETALDCKDRCHETPGCAYFSWWSDGGCHLSDEDAKQKPANGVVAGPASCQGCITVGYKWEPLDMPGTDRIETKTALECQEHCVMTMGCKYFSWWQDGGCHLEDRTAEHQVAVGVFSGPAKCKGDDLKDHVEERETPEYSIGCISIGFKFTPDMPGQERLETETDLECQKRCALTPGCAYFSWWTDGGCHFQDSLATQKKAAGVHSGLSSCKDCVSVGFKYEPLDMEGHERVTAYSATDCRLKCERVHGCAYFSWWKDGGCHFHDKTATRKPKTNVHSGPVICTANTPQQGTYMPPFECPTSLSELEHCVDNDHYCTAWADAGECIANPEYMSDTCAKSCCKFCNPSAPLGPGKPPRRSLVQPVRMRNEL